MRLEGGGNDCVLPRWKLEAVTHFPGVDEPSTDGHSSLPQQDVRAEANVSTALELRTEVEGRCSNVRQSQVS